MSLLTFYNAYKANPCSDTEDALGSEMLKFGHALLNKQYHRHGPARFRYEDAVSEAVMEVWERVKSEQFDDTKSSLKTYLQRSIGWRIIDMYRSDVRNLPLVEYQNTLIELKDAFGLLESRIDLTEVIQRLPSDLQLIVELTLSGYTGEEIGQKLHLSQQSVNKKYHEAIKKCQEIFKKWA